MANNKSFCLKPLLFVTTLIVGVAAVSLSYCSILQPLQTSEDGTKKNNFLTPGPGPSPKPFPRLEVSTTTFPCNVEVDRITKDLLKSMFREFVTDLLAKHGPNQEAFARQFADQIDQIIKYDIAVYKLCGSCQDIFNNNSDTDQQQPSFCAPDAYGYDATHSFNAFFPTIFDDDANNTQQPIQRPVPGKFRGSVYFHGMNVWSHPAPSDLMGRVPLQTLHDQANPMLPFFRIYLPLLIGVTSGIIGMAPDYLGYGESLPTHNRTTLYPPAYQQAAFVSLRTTQRLLQEWTGGCTILDNVLTTYGQSEGGYGTLAGAHGLATVAGIRILKNFAATPLMEIEGWINYFVQQEKLGAIIDFLQPIASLIAVSYSMNVPGIANSGTGQDMLHPDLKEATVELWKNADYATASHLLQAYQQFPSHPSSFAGLFNPHFIMQPTDTSLRCATKGSVGVNDKLCEATFDANLWRLMNHNSTTTFPTEICVSAADSIIPIALFPDNFFGSNPNVTRITSIFDVPLLTQEHGEAAEICLLHFVDNLLNKEQRHHHHPATATANEEEDDRPNYMQELEPEDLARCKINRI